GHTRTDCAAWIEYEMVKETIRNWNLEFGIWNLECATRIPDSEFQMTNCAVVYTAPLADGSEPPGPSIRSPRRDRRLPRWRGRLRRTGSRRHTLRRARPERSN